MNTFKITLLGDGGVGKTTLVKRHLTGEFEKKYVATLGVEVHPLRFNTNYGTKVLNIWDCAGQEKFGGLRDGYYIHSKGLIVMFELTSRTSFEHVEKWINLYKKVAGGPIVLCGTKCDLENKEVTNEMITTFINKYGIVYYEISSKSNYNFDKPFLELLKSLCSRDLFLKVTQ